LALGFDLRVEGKWEMELMRLGLEMRWEDFDADTTDEEDAFTARMFYLPSIMLQLLQF
jgi:hypothetical protein